jgi:hypothetical protein
MAKPKPASTSSAHIVTLKNILIGVTTSVLAAVAIYFLGIQDNSKEEFKKRKEATIKAWTAYTENKQIFSAVMKKFTSTNDNETNRININHEFDMAINNLENVKKETGADQRVYSTVDIMVEQMKNFKPIMNKFLDDIGTFAASNPTEEEGQAFMKKVAVSFRADMEALKARDTLRLNTFYQGLNKDYKIVLPLDFKDL